MESIINAKFSLPASDGKNYKLEDFSNKFSQLLIFFYPKDNTPGCTGEAKDFSSLQENFAKKDIGIVGISPDSVISHQKFIEKQDLSILLLADENKEFATKLGVFGEKKNYGKTYMGIIRSTFLVEIAGGKIIKEWKNVRAKGHAERIFQEIKAMNL